VCVHAVRPIAEPAGGLPAACFLLRGGGPAPVGVPGSPPPVWVSHRPGPWNGWASSRLSPCPGRKGGRPSQWPTAGALLWASLPARALCRRPAAVAHVGRVVELAAAVGAADAGGRTAAVITSVGELC